MILDIVKKDSSIGAEKLNFDGNGWWKFLNLYLIVTIWNSFQKFALANVKRFPTNEIIWRVLRFFFWDWKARTNKYLFS